MELGREIDHTAVSVVRFRHNVVAVGTCTSDAASASVTFRDAVATISYLCPFNGIGT
jgi:hypothetical protein